MSTLSRSGLTALDAHRGKELCRLRVTGGDVDDGYGVAPAIWNYKLGGYQVLKKWLSYREHTILDRPLTPEEVQYFADTARRIAKVLLLTSKIPVS